MPRIQVISIYGAAGKRTQTTHTFPAALREAVMVMGMLTHISLYYQGKPFLIDSGRYSYREDEPLRMEFKMLQAHNVCVVDDGSVIRPDGSWSFHSYGGLF